MLKINLNLSCHTLLFFVILCYFHLYFAISCHTERSEVSINLKREFAYLRRGFFILNLKRALNSLDFSLVSLSQNDKRCGYFANAQYDKCLRFSPFTKAQNDKSFHKIALYRVKFAIFG